MTRFQLWVSFHMNNTGNSDLPLFSLFLCINSYSEVSTIQIYEEKKQEFARKRHHQYLKTCHIHKFALSTNLPK